MARKRSRVRHIIEYLGLRLGLRLADKLSIKTASALAIRLADVWFILDAQRRRHAQANILRSGIATQDREIRRVARASFRHFALLVVESLKADPLLCGEDWRRHVEFDIPAETLRLLEEPGRGVLLVSGHLGNWEIAAQMLARIKPVVGITRPMNNPYTNGLIRARKERGQFRLTPKHDASPARLLDVLRRGEILALLVDQYAGSQGIMVDFFGHPASTHSSPALLHLITGAPICFGYCTRVAPMRFRFSARAPMIYPRSGRREEDVRAILTRLNTELENAIRAHPEQYLWAHRRWRD